MRRVSTSKANNMPTVKLGSHREVRLPADATRRLKLRRGAKLEVVVTSDGVFLIPLSRIPESQRYFYTPEWQAMEREADDDLKAGRTHGPFASAEAAVRELRSAKI